MQPNSSKTEDKFQLTFSIYQIQVLSFTINNSPEHQQLKPDYSYTFGISAGGLVDPVNKYIGVDFKTGVFTSNEKDDLVCELSVRIHYHINNFDDVVLKDENGFIIPDKAMQHLIAVTLSTARGILFERVQGTFLSKLILPIIDVTKMNKQDIPPHNG